MPGFKAPREKITNSLLGGSIAAYRFNQAFKRISTHTLSVYCRGSKKSWMTFLPSRFPPELLCQ